MLGERTSDLWGPLLLRLGRKIPNRNGYANPGGKERSPGMYEMFVAMNVTDAGKYALYRTEMMPILEKFGGGFRYDCIVSEVLRSAAPHPITRIFSIFFQDEAASRAFFSDPDYLAVKTRHYEASVDGFTVLAEHNVNESR